MNRRKNKENTIIRDYVLPDYANIRKGYAKPQFESTGKSVNSEQVKHKFKISYSYRLKRNLIKKIIRMNNECFTIPELLFNPSDIGINEMGISEAIVDSVQSCYKGLNS